MSNQKPSLPKGTRDFGPEVMSKRTYLLDTIKGVFRKFGFQPLETPTMENLSVLTGKYGDEGDQLLFKVLNSGDFFSSMESVVVREVARTNNALTASLFYFYDRINKQAKENFEREVTTVSREECNTILQKALQKPVWTFLNEQSFLNRDGELDNELWEEIKRAITDFFKNELGKHALYDIADYIEENPSEKTIDPEFYKEEYKRDRITTTWLAEFTAFLRDRSSKSSLSSKNMTNFIASKGLRYDLTVPFARYVVMNQHDITFPFRRYQVQPVWRADRPQRGRYREFYQCDADVVGTDSLLCEAEIILMLEEVFAPTKTHRPAYRTGRIHHQDQRPPPAARPSGGTGRARQGN